MYNKGFYKSPLGTIKIKSEGHFITAVQFTDEKVNSENKPEEDPIITQCKQELDEYFHNERIKFSIPCKLYGTPFQEEVWDKLKDIPFGRTKTYKDIAKKIGSFNLSRAVGQTNSLNPIAIIIPCHRVIGSNGNLTGYAGGIERKKWLLEFEQKVKQPELF